MLLSSLLEKHYGTITPEVAIQSISPVERSGTNRNTIIPSLCSFLLLLLLLLFNCVYLYVYVYVYMCVYF